MVLSFSICQTPGAADLRIKRPLGHGANDIEVLCAGFEGHERHHSLMPSRRPTQLTRNAADGCTMRGRASSHAPGKRTAEVGQPDPAVRGREGAASSRGQHSRSRPASARSTAVHHALLSGTTVALLLVTGLCSQYRAPLPTSACVACRTGRYTGSPLHWDDIILGIDDPLNVPSPRYRVPSQRRER